MSEEGTSVVTKACRFVPTPVDGVRGAYSRTVPRVPRSHLPDGLFHATGRAVGDTLLFRDADDYRTFLLFLLDVVDGFDWDVRALCLMGTHYQLVLDTLRTDLSAGMKRLNERYARSYNDRYSRHGHLFG